MTCAPRLLCAQKKRRKYIEKCTFRNSGTPVRRTRRRKSQTWTFRNFGAPVRRTRRRKSQQMDFQEVCDSCALNKTSYISNNALSEFLGLLCAEQNVGNRKKNTLSGIQVTKTNSVAWRRTFLGGIPLWGPRFEPKSSQIHPRGLFWTGALGPSCSSRPDEETHFAT